MRAKYINKTARRRSIRPDGDHYREMRKWRGEARERRRLRLMVAGAVVAVAALAVTAWLVLGGRGS
jgi:Tfp pilus assembly protein PilN